MTVIEDPIIQKPEEVKIGEIAVILNPTSGGGSASKLEAEICRVCNALRKDRRVRIYRTSRERSAEILAGETAAQKPYRVLLCGGDGTVSGGLAGLINSGVPTGLIPAGTGNLLAHNLELVRPASEGVEIALDGTVRPLDIIRIQTDRGDVFHSVVMAGAGYDAKIIAGTDKQLKRHWGVLAYLASAVQNLKPTSVRLQIRADNNIDAQYRAASVTMANVGQLQAGLSLIPDAQPDDGLLDIAVVEAYAFPDWLRVFWSVIRRRVWEEPNVSLLKVEKAVLEFARSQPFQFDGESAGRIRRLEVEVLPGAVQVMVPPISQNRE